MRKLYIFFVIVILLVISFFTGTYMYKISRMQAGYELSLQSDLQVEEAEIKTANSSEIKISPNAVITFETRYTKCDHTVSKNEEITASLVNCTKEELQAKYPEWRITLFSEKEIILYKESDASCKEHYVIREKDGNIAIYIIDENDDEVLQEVTSIPIEYLTDIDIESLKTGIEVTGTAQLNARLEDFE